MAAALRAAEGGGVYFFQILRGGIFKIFPARGVYPPTPSYSRPLLLTLSEWIPWDSFRAKKTIFPYHLLFLIDFLCKRCFIVKSS